MVSGEVDGLIGTVDGMMNLLDMPGSRLLLRLTDAPLAATIPGVGKEAIPSLREVAHGPLLLPRGEGKKG